jgi:hypothetical protein
MSIKAAIERYRKWQEPLREPGLTALLVLQVALIFGAIPLAGMGVAPLATLPVMFALLVIAILVVTSRSHAVAAAVLISVVISLLGNVVRQEHPSVLTDWLSAGGRLLLILALSWVIARAVFGPGRVTLHRVQGAIVLYLNCALFFFTIYRLIVVLDPDAFAGLSQAPEESGSGAGLLYFSFSTLTTAGFGDISPVNPMARSMANLESIIGQLYPATLLARLVSLEVVNWRG